MNQSRRRPSNKSKNSSYFNTQMNSYQTAHSPKRFTDLNKRFEPPLHVSSKPKSNSMEEESREQRNTLQATALQKSRSNIIYRKPNLMEAPSTSHESSPSESETSKSIKIFEMDRSRRRSSNERQNSPSSNTQVSSDQTGHSSTNYTDLNKMFESSLHVSSKPESNSKEAESRDQRNIPQTSAFLKNRSEIISRKPSLMEAPSTSHESSPSESETSKGIKISEMDQSRRRSSNESQNSESQSTDQIAHSSKNYTDLNKVFKSSLQVSSKPESKSTEAESYEQRNIPQTSAFQKGRSNILSRQPSLMETLYRPYDSNPGKGKISESIKTVDHISPPKTVDPKQEGRIQQPPPLYSGRPPYTRSNYHQNAQYFRSTVPMRYPPEFHPNVNPALLHRSTNPVKNQVCRYAGRYPQQSSVDTNIVHTQKTDGMCYQNQTELPSLKHNNAGKSQLSSSICNTIHSRQCQMQQPMIKTTARPIVLLPRSMTNYNRMPPIRNIVIPMQYLRSLSLYRNRMLPVRANAAPLQYVGPSFQYQYRKPQFRRKRTSMQYAQHLRATTTNVSGGTDFLPDVSQTKFDLKSETPVQVSTLPLKQPQNLEPKETANPNTTTLKLVQLNKVMQHEEATKTACYSKRTILEVDVPTKLPATSYFPSYSIPQGRIVYKPIHWPPIKFPPPSRSAYFAYTTALEKGIIPQQPYQPQSTSHDYSYVHSVVTDQHVPPPATEGNVPIQYESHAGNPKQPENQEENVTSYNVQCQPVIQNQTAVPHYQDPNARIYQHQTEMPNLTATPHYQDPYPLINQYGTQYQHPMQNLTAAPQYQDPNALMYQYHPEMQNLMENPQYQDPDPTIYQYENQYQHPMQNIAAAPQYQDPNDLMYQYQSEMHNLTSTPQYHDPNSTLYQCGTQYQYPMQNLTETPQYQYPNQPLYQYETQTPLETSWSTCDGSIPFQEENSNIAPVQTSTNPSLTSLEQKPTWPYGSGDPSYPITGEPNSEANISGVQT